MRSFRSRLYEHFDFLFRPGKCFSLVWMSKSVCYESRRRIFEKKRVSRASVNERQREKREKRNNFYEPANNSKSFVIRQGAM